MKDMIMTKVIDFNNVRGPMEVVEDELELANVAYLGICMVTATGDTIVSEAGTETLGLYDASIFAHHFEQRRQACLAEIDDEAEKFE